METIKDKLILFLEKQFGGVHCDLECLPAGTITGSLIWEGFAKHDHAERQHVLWEKLRTEFSNREDLAKIGAILTLTPEEYEVELES
ncbi:MAG: hypothetical protein IID41_07160 [Planctomycetes bacterium]|nr:hypothetical protein [Planctomycetota bacterium]